MKERMDGFVDKHVVPLVEDQVIDQLLSKLLQEVVLRDGAPTTTTVRNSKRKSGSRDNIVVLGQPLAEKPTQLQNKTKVQTRAPKFIPKPIAAKKPPSTLAIGKQTSSQQNRQKE